MSKVAISPYELFLLLETEGCHDVIHEGDQVFSRPQGSHAPRIDVSNMDLSKEYIGYAEKVRKALL